VRETRVLGRATPRGQPRFPLAGVTHPVANRGFPWAVSVGLPHPRSRQSPGGGPDSSVLLRETPNPCFTQRFAP